MALPDVGCHNLYNMDESGIQFGVLQQAKRLITTDTFRPSCRSPHNRELATIIDCISAIGTSIQPTVILSAKSHCNNWYPREGGRASGWHFAISPNGYTNNQLGLIWLTEVFDKQIAALANGCPKVLVVNGHSSHESVEFMTYCFEHKIYLL